MKCAVVLTVSVALTGCAMEPMSPEQRESMARMFEANAQQSRASMAEAQQRIYVPQRQAVPPPPDQPQGVSAFWTGNSHQAQSVTGALGFNCQYNYAGHIFWRMFAGSCPSSIQVQ